MLAFRSIIIVPDMLYLFFGGAVFSLGFGFILFIQNRFF